MSATGSPAIVIADGDAVPAALAAIRAELAGDPLPPLAIAADGGAAKALAAGLRPDLVLGDGDSLAPAVRDALVRSGVELRLVAPEKDESDTELCLTAAIARGARRIRIAGALGGPRVEHAIANLLLLAHPMLDGLDVAIVAPPSSIRRVGSADAAGSLEIIGVPGDHVSLLPVDGRVEGVRTAGLRYPLAGEPLVAGPARGLSNELLGTTATVTTVRGRLLVIHTARVAATPEVPVP